MHDEEETKQQDEQQEEEQQQVEEKAERPHFTLEVHNSKMGSRSGFVKEEEKKQDG